MASPIFPGDQVLLGDCIELMNQLPAESVDVVFADPPYNLQLRQELWRPNLTQVSAVNDSWDQFEDFESYDRFTHDWLQACRRVLKPSGTLWVIGTYHNIYRVGAILQDLKYWILNDVVWIKSNPMPNFRGMRLTNAHETLIWAQKERGARYTFNYHALKQLNEGLQMRSDWYFPICSGKERLRENGSKVHSTQKPLALLYRILSTCTQPGDLLLDPFFGTGTSGVAARHLGRHFIGIERDPHYVEMARKRLEDITPFGPAVLEPSPNLRRGVRLPFGRLLESGLITPGATLFFGPESDLHATVQADASISFNKERGSIHQIARFILADSDESASLYNQPARSVPVNGWQVWYYRDENDGKKYPIDHLRQILKSQIQKQEEEL